MAFTWHQQTLDIRYPHLSALVSSVLSVDLETLASRAPASGYLYFDLERLLAHVRAIPMSYGDDFCDHIYGLGDRQVRGYLATLEAFIALGVVRDVAAFVTKKLAAPKMALPSPSPKSSEMLDTLVECSWGLWLHARHGNLETEKPLPGGIGDADFYVDTADGPLWVDCLSVGPQNGKHAIPEYLRTTVRKKWLKKFGARPAAAGLPSAITVTMLKSQENVAPALIRDEIVGAEYAAPPSIWRDCPGLRAAWFAMPPWEDTAHLPTVVATWERP